MVRSAREASWADSKMRGRGRGLVRLVGVFFVYLIISPGVEEEGK